MSSFQDPGGQHGDPAVQEPLGRRRAVPSVPADEAERRALGRRRLGDAGWARQDGLVAGALHRLLPELPRQRLPAERGGVGVRPGPIRRRLVRRRRGGAGRREAAAAAEGGAGKVHDIRLLHRLREVPRWRLPQGVWVAVGYIQCWCDCFILFFIGFLLEERELERKCATISRLLVMIGREKTIDHTQRLYYYSYAYFINLLAAELKLSQDCCGAHCSCMWIGHKQSKSVRRRTKD
jgi:hypothetical protein